MNRPSKRSYNACSKFNVIPAQQNFFQENSPGSSDTDELVKRSTNMVHELSSLLEKESTDVEVSMPSGIKRCKVAAHSQMKKQSWEKDGFLVTCFDGRDVQSTGRESQNPVMGINPENGMERRKLTSKEKPCLPPTHKRSLIGRQATPPSIPTGGSRGRLQFDGPYCRTSDEESNDDNDDEYDDDIETWFEDVQFHDSCIFKDDKSDAVVLAKTLKYILQTFQIASERYPQGKTLKILKQKFKYLANCKRYLGAIPGVEVGDFFYDRIELSLIGLHHDLHAKIGCIEHDGNTVAASIVASGFHGHIMDGSELFTYPGCEGYSGFSLKNGRLTIDRKFESGILALKNSIETCTPVRVIYCLSEELSESRVGKPRKVAAYIYDGLYVVEKYWFVCRKDGFSTYNFQLRKNPGQPRFDIRELLISRPLKMRFGLRMEDISEGKEKKPVSVVNIIDSELPDSFTYITKTIYPPRYHKLKAPSGCNCVGGCSDLVKCQCLVKNGGELPFNCEGGIVRARPLVYECGPACKCPPSCQNRVSQLGFEYRLEIFKTRSRGWGIRSLDKIPSGSFVCEYTGEMLEDAEAGKRTNDEYLFDIGRNYHDKSLWEGLPLVPSLKSTPSNRRREGGFTIDSVAFGNIGRFINHSCSPNLYAQNILYDHSNHRLPHIMFFASEDIFPLEELTYHYNYHIDGVRDSDGKIRRKACLCGSDECTGRLY